MDLERIYREYFTIVYCYILSLSKDATVAEDITQETFFRAMKKLDEFRGDSSVETWLIQIAKRLYYNYADKSSRRKQIDEAQPDVRPRQESIEDGFIRKEYSKRINRILHDLNEPYKEVFMLRVYGELSFKEIGELFMKSDAWARVTFHRARNMIREVLENEDKL
ncbi:MAG: sigma-70 family RNA polymerase sigma factor [Firmicutes bacterium]|nr:sigma-70 family RNA polymerase sigma factor [Bacillota bacterium]MBQ5955193.1 sigma-70 family RNA polymerase sigma factor [Bacillota bacterium]